MSMQSPKRNKEVFTVSPHYIQTGSNPGVDLYINSSGRENVEHFVCIWKKASKISYRDLHQIQEKYGHIYVLEKDRADFFESIGDRNNLSKEEKIDFLKTEATKYIDKLFHSNHQEMNTKVLNQCLNESSAAVRGMVKTIKDNDVFGLSELIAQLDFHDHYTLDHSINTGLYNIIIYKELLPNADEQNLILAGLCGMFHDIGKIQLPNSIINATSALAEEQYKEIQKHPAWGKELLAREGINFNQKFLSVISAVVYEHHENFNGTGYPNQLKGEDINIFARMTAISDFFDAITTKRSYHEPVDPETALGIIANSCGKKIDPKLFALFERKVMKGIKVDRSISLPDNFDPCMPHQHLQGEDCTKKPKLADEQASEDSTLNYTWYTKQYRG
jgi:HD-GYP domain-containing protein (c-di-GMP phosphodiesterase class II)